MSAQRDSCVSLLLLRRNEYKSHYIQRSKINRLARIEQNAKGTGVRTESGSSKVYPKKNVKNPKNSKHATKTGGLEFTTSKNPVVRMLSIEIVSLLRRNAELVPCKLRLINVTFICIDIF